MRSFFKELIKGNLPEGFSIEKGEDYFDLYHSENPSKDLIMSFNYEDTKRAEVEEKFKEIFRIFGYRLNNKTKEWER